MIEPHSVQRLLIATNNTHKSREFKEILGDRFEVLSLSDLPPAPVPDESGETFQENAEIKALAASLFFDGWVLADDSGLAVDALNGAPGVYSARYAGANATDATNRARLIQELDRLHVPDENRSARFVCVIAIAKKGELLACFEGSAEGMIIREERGSGGFGYDPIFVPGGFDQTFAELGAEIKNSISHRNAASLKAIRWLQDNTD